MAWNAAADARVLRSFGMIVQPQKRFAPAQESAVECKSSTSAAQLVVPPFKHDVRRWQYALRFKHNNLVKIRLLSQGAGEILVCIGVHLHSHIVAVVRFNAAACSPTCFAAERRCCRGAYSVKGRRKRVLSDRVGAA